MTYRTRLSLRLAVMAAAAFWACILGMLVGFQGVAPQTFLSAVAFLVFFIVFSAHYDRMAITVTGEGIVVNRIFRRQPVSFDEILGIEVRTGLGGTLYEVLTRRGLVHFSSLTARHRELFHLLLERADLHRRR